MMNKEYINLCPESDWRYEYPGAMALIGCSEEKRRKE